MTENLQPDWRHAPEWAKFWAIDSSGNAYWYKDKPTYQYYSIDAGDDSGFWKHVGGNDKRIWGVTFAWDSNWPPEGLELRDTIRWDSTLRVRP